jgi:hypothetical protein
MENVLDVFKGDGFSVLTQTDAVNKRPFVPGRIGELGIFREVGISTTVAEIEERQGKLYLVPAKERGAPATVNAQESRKKRFLEALHLPVTDKLEADEVQNIIAFGGGNKLQTIQEKLNEKYNTIVQSLDATLEHLRMGAIKGIVYDADGTTVLYNLFTEFGITPESLVDFDLDNPNGDGLLRQTCADVIRRMANNLGATPFMGVHAECGDAFFDNLLKNEEVRESYKGTPMAQVLREPYVYPNGKKVFGAFEFGGIVFENYRGSVGGTPFVNTNACHMFPVGAPDLFTMAFAPANYLETVNKPGVPMYAKVTPHPKNTHVDVDVQSNPLPYCTRPKVLMQGVDNT